MLPKLEYTITYKNTTIKVISRSPAVDVVRGQVGDIVIPGIHLGQYIMQFHSPSKGKVIVQWREAKT